MINPSKRNINIISLVISIIIFSILVISINQGDKNNSQIDNRISNFVEDIYDNENYNKNYADIGNIIK